MTKTHKHKYIIDHELIPPPEIKTTTKVFWKKKSMIINEEGWGEGGECTLVHCAFFLLFLTVYLWLLSATLKLDFDLTLLVFCFSVLFSSSLVSFNKSPNTNKKVKRKKVSFLLIPLTMQPNKIRCYFSLFGRRSKVTVVAIPYHHHMNIVSFSSSSSLSCMIFLIMLCLLRLIESHYYTTAPPHHTATTFNFPPINIPEEKNSIFDSQQYQHAMAFLIYLS